MGIPIVEENDLPDSLGFETSSPEATEALINFLTLPSGLVRCGDIVYGRKTHHHACWPGETRVTALWSASFFGFVKIMKRLLDSGVDIEETSESILYSTAPIQQQPYTVQLKAAMLQVRSFSSIMVRISKQKHFTGVTGVHHS
jgi:hypothetical protein